MPFTIKSKVINGRLSEFARNTIKDILPQFEGKEIEINIKQVSRSLKQNRYRWGVVIQTILNEVNRRLEEEGLPKASSEDIDLFIKSKLGMVTIVDLGELGQITIQGKFRTKTPREFEEIMTAIRALADAHNIYIPLPGEK